MRPFDSLYRHRHHVFILHRYGDMVPQR